MTSTQADIHPSKRGKSPRHKSPQTTKSPAATTSKYPPEFVHEHEKGTKAWKELDHRLSHRPHTVSFNLKCRAFNVDIDDSTSVPFYFVGKPWHLQSNTIYLPSIGSSPAAFKEDEESLGQAIVTQSSIDSELIEYTCSNFVIGRLIYTNLTNTVAPTKCSKLDLKLAMRSSWNQLVKPPAGCGDLVTNAKRQLNTFIRNLVAHIETDKTCAIVETEIPSNSEYSDLVILARDRITPPLKTPGSSSVLESQQVGWETCVAVIKFCKEKPFLDTSEANQTMSLAKSVRDIFAHQPHRRYVHTIIVTEYSYSYQRWDRAGLVQSPLALYRRKGTRGKVEAIKNAQISLIGLLECLVSWHTDLQGFEDTICYSENGELYLSPTRILSSTIPGTGDFILKERLLQSYTLASRGTIGWLAIDTEDDSTWLIIDNWIPHEEFFKRQGVVRKLCQLPVDGVAGLLPFEGEEMVNINRTGEKDAVYDNRTWEPNVGRNASSVHIRAFWRRHNHELRPLEMAPTVKHILFACRDVVKALEFLYLQGKIVHRDITIWNIAWCESSEGPKGFLLDFSCAAMLQGDMATCEPRADVTPGARLFMSINALGNRPTEPCDDLESLFYVLLWIFSGHTQLPITRSKATSLSPILRQWETFAEDQVATDKVEFFQILPDGLEKEFFLQKHFEFLVVFIREFYEALVDYESGSESVTKNHERCFQRVLLAFETVCKNYE